MQVCVTTSAYWCYYVIRLNKVFYAFFSIHFSSHFYFISSFFNLKKETKCNANWTWTIMHNWKHKSTQIPKVNDGIVSCEIAYVVNETLSFNRYEVLKKRKRRSEHSFLRISLHPYPFFGNGVFMMRNSHSFDNEASSNFEFQLVKKRKLKLFNNFPKSLVLVLDKLDFKESCLGVGQTWFLWPFLFAPGYRWSETPSA